MQPLNHVSPGSIWTNSRPHVRVVVCSCPHDLEADYNVLQCSNTMMIVRDAELRYLNSWNNPSQMPSTFYVTWFCLFLIIVEQWMRVHEDDETLPREY